MLKKEKHWIGILLLGMMLFLPTCTSTYKSSGFLGDYAHLREGENFKQMYVAPEVDFSVYKKVKVLPVNTDYLSKKEKLTPQEISELAEYFKTLMEIKLGDKYKILAPAEEADKETLFIETALTKLGSTKRILNAVTTLLIWIPVHGGSVAFEAKITEGSTGKLIAQVAEKRSGGHDVGSATIGFYTKHGQARSIFEIWAGHLRDMLR